MTEEYKFLPNVPLDGLREAEELRLKGLSQLSFHERNDINEEVHCVRCIAREETTHLLHSSLFQLSIELANIPNKPAFDKSQTLFPNDTFVNTVDFRLRFLRLEFFNAQKAAIRIVSHLELLDKLFEGNEVLRRPIKLSDLSRAEMKILRLGSYQLLPFRDRRGRPIIGEVGDMGFQHDLKMRMKIRLYMHYVASNDVESQRKGIICIAWPEGDFTNTPMPLTKENRRLLRLFLDATPIRIVCVHFCMPDTLYFQLLRSFLIIVMPSYMTSRLRFHVATGIERRYSLMGFGIPVEMIPITDSGNIKRTYLYQWIKVRSLIESIENTDDTEIQRMIVLPCSKDVLIRKGTTTLSHPGNVFFRGLIEMKHEEFRSGSDLTQSFLAEDIVNEIERINGRFLTWDSRGFWTDLTDRSQIIFKVEVSIRDFNVRIKARKNVQIIESSTCDFKREDKNKRKRKTIANDVNDLSSSDADSGICSFSC